LENLEPVVAMEAEQPMPERTVEEQRLDTEIATRLMGFRWVEWGRGADGPLREPGRFLAKSASPLAHLHRPADTEVPMHDHPLSRVPRYSAALEHAFEASQAAALFTEGRAVLSQEPDLEWVIEVRGLRLTSRRLAELLCRASLDWRSAATGE
jgi:hypothetical protein